jgi:NAD(P)-dependent dehydrogenase (short-subunit alcohol dehydrogenase family)
MAKTVLFTGNESRLEQALRMQFAALDYTLYTLPATEFENASLTDVAHIVQELREQVGQIDVFLWGNLYAGDIPFGELDLSTYRAYMHKAVHSAFYLSQACIKHMERQRFGKLLFLTSIAGTLGDPEFLLTVASGCLNTFARSIAREEARRGITTNVLALGRIDEWAVTQQETINRFYEHYYPFRQDMSIIQLAQAIVRMATDQTNTINGQIVRLDGGTL